MSQHPNNRTSKTYIRATLVKIVFIGAIIGLLVASHGTLAPLLIAAAPTAVGPFIPAIIAAIELILYSALAGSAVDLIKDACKTLLGEKSIFTRAFTFLSNNKFQILSTVIFAYLIVASGGIAMTIPSLSTLGTYVYSSLIAGVGSAGAFLSTIGMVKNFSDFIFGRSNKISTPAYFIRSIIDTANAHKYKTAFLLFGGGAFLMPIAYGLLTGTITLASLGATVASLPAAFGSTTSTAVAGYASAGSLTAFLSSLAPVGGYSLFALGCKVFHFWGFKGAGTSVGPSISPAAFAKAVTQNTSSRTATSPIHTPSPFVQFSPTTNGQQRKGTIQPFTAKSKRMLADNIHKRGAAIMRADNIESAEQAHALIAEVLNVPGNTDGKKITISYTDSCNSTAIKIFKEFNRKCSANRQRPKRG